MKSFLRALFLIFPLFFAVTNSNKGCTNYIITKGASADGSVMITYAADSHTRYGAIAFYPAADHAPGSFCDIYHYESGKWLGAIPEAPHTYSVVQFMNEHQVAVGETTFGGLDSLSSQPGALLDYGSLMKIALQRSKTARECIRVMTELVARYGYASSGESFSVSDKHEAWILEMIGKGKYERGAVWVAMLVPDGYVSGHANQARITRFPIQKSNNWSSTSQTVYHSPDVVTFARKHGFYAGADEAFSFSDVYNPLNFGGARYCDARVWTFFRKISKSVRENETLTGYAMGEFSREKVFPDGSANPASFVTNRLPLWVRPDSLISLKQLMNAMRDHYEGTPLEMRYDLGAGPYESPYRWRPMEYKVDGVTYLNERAVATQQTGYSFVAQSRPGLPDPVGGIFWFGVDDADGCVYAPMFCGIRSIPYSYRTGTGSMIQWSDSSAFWTFNQLNNFAYSRYNVIHPEIEAFQNILENELIEKIASADRDYSEIQKKDPEAARNLITSFSEQNGNELVRKWKDFYRFLFMKYMDGNKKQTEGFQLLENGYGKNVPKRPSHPGYGNRWERKMAEDGGDRLKVPENK